MLNAHVGVKSSLTYCIYFHPPVDLLLQAHLMSCFRASVTISLSDQCGSQAPLSFFHPSFWGSCSGGLISKVWYQGTHAKNDLLTFCNSAPFVGRMLSMATPFADKAWRASSGHFDHRVTSSRHERTSDLLLWRIWPAKVMLGGSLLFSYFKKTSGVMPRTLAVIHNLCSSLRFCFIKVVSVCCLVCTLLWWLKNKSKSTFFSVSLIEFWPGMKLNTYSLWKLVQTEKAFW